MFWHGLLSLRKYLSLTSNSLSLIRDIVKALLILPKIYFYKNNLFISFIVLWYNLFYHRLFCHILPSCTSIS